MIIEGFIECAQDLSSVNMVRIFIALVSCVLSRGVLFNWFLSFENKSYESCVDDKNRVELICVVRFCILPWQVRWCVTYIFCGSINAKNIFDGSFFEVPCTIGTHLGLR